MQKLNTDVKTIGDTSSPGLHSFTQKQQAVLSRDLLELKTIVGGSAGSIKVGGQEVPNVLRVGTGLYVTTEKVPSVVETALGIDAADIHLIRNRADLTQFVERFQAFNKA